MRNFFSRSRNKKLKSDEVRIVLPPEHFTVMKWKQDGLPCVGTLNSGLQDFPHKKIFAWHLSVMIDFRELADNGMPTQEEQMIVDPFCDQLDETIKAGGNAVFLVRETWNKTRRMMWQVYDPERAHAFLQSLIATKNHPRPFDYQMEQDPAWTKSNWYFDQLKRS